MILSVRKAFEKALKPILPSIAWENVLFTPRHDTSFIRLKMNLIRSAQAIIGPGQKRRDGVVFLDLFTPSRKGPKPSDELLESVLAIFEDGSVFEQDGYRVHIGDVRISPTLQEETWMHVPVTIVWYSYFNS